MKDRYDSSAMNEIIISQHAQISQTVSIHSGSQWIQLQMSLSSYPMTSKRRSSRQAERQTEWRQAAQQAGRVYNI